MLPEVFFYYYYFYIFLFRAGVLGDGFGALADRMLGQLTRQQQSHCRLDLPAGDGRPFVVVGQPGSLRGDPLENVVHETVHDAHRFAGDASVGMDLFQHFVYINSVALLPSALYLLVPLGDVLLRLSGLLGRFPARLRRHGWTLRHKQHR